jgi:RNA polymerase sigma-70 factor (ECF subfamily)
MEDSAGRPLFAALQTHYEELLAFVRRRVRCPALAADIVQETCIRVASGGGAAAAIENPRAFLYRVAGNLAIDHVRQERTRAKYVTSGPLPENVPDGRPAADASIDARRRLALLARAVDELPPRCRQVFILRKFEGLDQAEIAQELGISRNMVEKHLRKALAHCAMRLNRD